MNTPPPKRALALRGGGAALLRGDVFGCFSSGIGGALHEVRDQLEFGVVVSGEELVHGATESGVQAQELGVAVPDRSHEYGAAVGWVSFADDPAAFLESVEDPGHRRGGGCGAVGERGWGERAVGVEDVEAVEVDVLEPEL